MIEYYLSLCPNKNRGKEKRKEKKERKYTYVKDILDSNIITAKNELE